MRFRENGPALVGVIHLNPLPGSPRSSLTMASLRARTAEDALALAAAGFDAVLVENFGDAPFYRDAVPPETVAAMAVLVGVARSASGLPVGVNILRNDGASALAVAVATEARFIRVNILAGARVADQGVIQTDSARLLRMRRHLDAAGVGIVADVGVKHSTSLGANGDEAVAEEAVEVVERALADVVVVTGVRTGYYDLDRLTAGLQKGDLIVLAARPSMGKTALAINIAEHVALNEGLPVAVFSMEMGAAQLAVRIVGSIGRIDQSHLRTGKLTDEEWPRLTEAIEKLRTISLHIDESAGLTSGELRANARRLSRQCGQLGLIVVDYLQLMSGSSGSDGENRATELGEISRGLKMLAKELKCPVIALSQLNRSVESRPDKRPMMSDLRESGAIEQDADICLLYTSPSPRDRTRSRMPSSA